MKLILTALCASFMVIPTAFADDCEKGKCDKEKKEEGTLAHCGKCGTDKDHDKDKKKDDKKEEGTIASDCDKCKKAKSEMILAEGDKCKKDGDCDKEKEEGTLASDCDKCKKDGEGKKEEGTLADNCEKDGGCDKEKKEEGTLADCGKCKKDKDHGDDEKKEGTLA